MKAIENMPAQQSFDDGKVPAWNWVRWLQSLVAWLYLAGTYTPTISSGSGAFTTVSGAGRYWKIGSFVFVQITATITTNGTAATNVRASLPFASANVSGVNYIFSGRGLSSGKSIYGLVQPNQSLALINNYDGTYPGADGETLYISGFFEAT